MDARALLVVVIVGCGGGTGTDVGAGPDSMPDVVPPSGLVAWFTFDRTTNDTSSNHYLMATGGSFASFLGDGYHGGGAYMDGVSQYGLVNSKDSPDGSLDFAGAFTIALWIRPGRTPTDFEVIASRSFGSGTESSYAFAIDSTLRLRYDSQGGSSLVGATQLALGQWAHVGLTYDGTDKRVFINGALDGSSPAAAPVGWDHQYLFFGADEGASEYVAEHRLQGSLDDVMLFNRALAPSEFAELAAQ